MTPGDVVTFWDRGRFRAGRYVRTIARGRRKGWIVVRVVNKLVELPPDHADRKEKA